MSDLSINLVVTLRWEHGAVRELVHNYATQHDRDRSRSPFTDALSDALRVADHAGQQHAPDEVQIEHGWRV